MSGRHALIWIWTLAVLVFVYLPALSILLASLTSSRYFLFPIKRWGLDWWRKTFASIEVHQLFETSITIALCVTVVAVMVGFFGALAFARYNWTGRRCSRRSCSCRSSSRSRCSGLLCCCGSTPSG